MEVKREFTAPNGVKKTFYYREGTNDESTIIACFEQDYYEILKQGFKAGDILLDLGAHIGGVTLLMSTIPGIKIISVEAIPENYNLLNKNIEANTGVASEIVTYNKAILDRSGLTEIFYGEDTEIGRMHNFMGTVNLSKSEEFASKRESVKIETVSLKGLFEKEKIAKCRFLKIDIEGSEEKVLCGAPRDILGRIDTIRGEYHFGDYKRLLKRLSGFEDITPENMNPIKESLTEFMWRNKNDR